MRKTPIQAVAPPPSIRGPTAWTEPLLRRAVEAFQSSILRARPVAPEQHDCTSQQAVVDEIVRLGMQPEIHAALCQRCDPQVAIHDLATRYAFSALMVERKCFDQLDPMSQALVQHTLKLIYQRAEQVANWTDENPLDEQDDLLLSICGTVSRYVPHKPMNAHISWKLRHYESAGSRAVRQIENLVQRPEIVESFAAYVIESDAPDMLKARLLQLARGGGRHDLDYEAVVRFFARPETAAFVKRFAGTVQTARTLYGEDEYAGISWQGRRRLPAHRRQGYLEIALARFDHRQELSLDDESLHLDSLAGFSLGWPDSDEDDNSLTAPDGQSVG